MRLRGAALVAASLTLAIGAPAHVPSASRVTEAVASTNGKAGRARGLRMEVELRGPDGRAEAAGTAWLEPDGSGRLLLRDPDGGTEEHRLAGGRYQVLRDGRPVSQPRPLLPPLQVLQAGSAAELRGVLSGFGVATGTVELGFVGDQDCYVLGGRAGTPPAAPRAALWVDVETLEAVRIDRRDGVRYRLGPPLGKGRIRFPSWVDVETPGGVRWRLTIRSVVPGSLPASAPPAR